jgi:hypothetical protein
MPGTNVEARMNPRKINHLLNTELSAVETYEQALQEKEWNVLGPDPQAQALFPILVDHLQAASRLGSEVRRLGGRPVSGPQVWDGWSHRRMDAARLFGDVNQVGDKVALEVLKKGEESGLKKYQAALHHDALSPEVEPLIRSLETLQQAHVRALDDLMMETVP